MTTIPAAHDTATVTANDGRHRSLDILRGIAILGTLGTNIFLFVDVDIGTSFAATLLSGLTNGKFLGLLTIMFGIGLAIQQDAALRRHRRWPLVYIWRGVLLLLDGVLHYILLFQWDVLMAYAVTGLVVAYILSTSRGVQRVVLGVALTVHLVLLTLPVLGISVPLPGGVALATGEWAPSTTPAGETEDTGVLRSITEPVGESAELETWWSGVVARVTDFWDYRGEAVFILPMGIALFLIGAMLLRAGVLEPRGRRIRTMLMIVGFVAAAYELAVLLVPEVVPHPPGNFGRYFVATAISFGILAVVVMFYQRRRIGWAGTRLEDVGRMALTCYVGQNIVATFFFSDWALNLDRLIPDSWEIGKVVACYAIVATIVVVFASLWRRRFARGPLEWSWNAGYRLLSRLTPSWNAPVAVVPTKPAHTEAV
ncbi:DUF418 domain-containing protein [Zhihengliuella sp. ISTPL4]|uniref:DUF418 domain-containing protein n=1 Tax=Zhihengliuella sp. ISTPL4 TaxID=2058657 RepID=UPI000C7BE82D|nr:DUF418 domain-containing protein [Zhihengliuella sp. ISTPL4]